MKLEKPIEKADWLLLAAMRCVQSGKHDMAKIWMSKYREIIAKCAEKC